MPFVRADPAEAGFSPERLLRVGEFLAAEIERDRIPGAVVLDAEIGEYLPQFADRRVADLSRSAGKTAVVTLPPERQPTVLDLLRHTAGCRCCTSRERCGTTGGGSTSRD